MSPYADKYMTPYGNFSFVSERRHVTLPPFDDFSARHGMQIRTPRELGACVRDARRRLGMTQAQLADRARVSRTWVVDLEAGKRTLEVGLVLSVLELLGITVQLGQPGAPEERSDAKPAAYATLEIAPAQAVLDRVDPKTGSRS